jgi:aminopeptidase N
MPRILPSAIALLTFVLIAPAQEPLRTAGERPVDIKHIRLDLKVDLPKRTVDAEAFLRFRTFRPTKHVTLDAVGFEVKHVVLGAVNASDENNPEQDKPRPPLTFRHDGKKLDVDLPAEWPAEQDGWLVISYRVREPKDGLFFFGPTATEPNVPFTVWSQGESITNRYWFPCLDHPDQKQTTELVVTVAHGFEVLSNGKLVETKPNDDKTVTFHWKQDQPHVSYLVTLVVGKFDIVREQWNGKEVSYYVPVGRKSDIARTFGRTREMLDFYSRRFGIDYPWEKYSQIVVEQFTAGGMENTSATTLTDWGLISERAALDSDAEGLIAHELAHQWWGDLVTCRDWSHVWLNEGWASFCEVLWAEHGKGKEEAAYDLIHKARAVLGNQTAKERPIVDRRYAFPDAMFDARAYPKGAWVLHMLREQLGETDFWKAVKAYGSEHKYKSVETRDFRGTLERVTGRNLERFFYDWTERPGWPVLETKVEYLGDDKLTKIHVKQAQAGEPFHLTLPIRYFTGESGNGAWHEERLPMTEKEQTFFIRNTSPKQFEIDPRLTLLTEWKIDQGRHLWAEQLNSSPSVAVRIRAAEHFGKSKEPADRELLAECLKSEKFWAVAAEIARALGESGGDTSRDALIAGLKGQHPKVRRACAEAMGKLVGDPRAASALKEVLKAGDTSEYVESAAIEAYAKLRQNDTVTVLLPCLVKPSDHEMLRTAALRGLGESQDMSALDTLVSWTHRGKPRETRSAALRALATLARSANPTDEQCKQIADAIAACLEGETQPIRRAAVEAIRELGQSATPSVPVLEMIARHETNDRIAELAKKALEQIRANTPAPVEVTRLREELEKLKKDNESLRERLQRVEKR